MNLSKMALSVTATAYVAAPWEQNTLAVYAGNVPTIAQQIPNKYSSLGK
jgi:hypothetical protein